MSDLYAYECIGTHEPLSPEWFAARMDGLGGSEIAAVLGLSKWQSPFSLWHYKAGNLPPQTDNDAMEWGRRLEAVVRAKFAEEHPEFVVVDTPGTYRNRERVWQIANPDALLFDSADLMPSAAAAVYEGKTARYDDEWGKTGSDEIPVSYLVQTRWMLDLFGLDTAHVAVLISGCDYREYVIHPDDADTALMREAAAEFMQSLADGTAPGIDSHTATYEAVRRVHPGIERVDVEVDDELAHNWIDACRAAKDADAARRYFASQLLDAMGTARRATVDGTPVALRIPASNGVPYLKATKESA